MTMTLSHSAKVIKASLPKSLWYLVDILLYAAEEYEESRAGANNTKSGVYATRTDREIE